MSLLNPWALLGIAIALAIAFLSGMRAQSERYKAQLLVQERAMHEAYVRTVREQRARAQAVSQELSHATLKRQSDAVAFRAELARARTGAVQLAVCDPVGTGVRLTRDFSRLYDGALAIGAVPSPGDPGRADAPAPGAGDALPVDVLAVHAENAEAWAECRATLRGWQSLARRNGWVQ